MIQRRSLLALAPFLSSLAAASLTAACAAPTPAFAAWGQLVQVQLVDRHGGGVLREHRHRGSAWVAGHPGERYAVRLTNRTGERVLVVLSVDGINAVSGQTAATSQTGYVLAPWQSADITGWRKSDAEAAAFYFTALPDSYAARTDRPANVGVIGAAVFRERRPVPRPVPFEVSPGVGGSGGSGARGDPYGRRGDGGEGTDAARGRRAEAPSTTPAPSSSATSPSSPPAPPSPPPPAPAAAARPSADASGEAAVGSAARRDSTATAIARSERLGTGHGEREYAPITRTHFERASATPAEIVQIRYDSDANLVAAGVIPAPPPHHVPAPRPEPFPAYVPDPR